MKAWLVQAGCTHVVMESTDSYGKPVFNVLEGSLLDSDRNLTRRSSEECNVSETFNMSSSILPGAFAAVVFVGLLTAVRPIRQCMPPRKRLIGRIILFHRA
jgi:hypothetical protein